MTGFAAVRHPTSAGELSISLRSVNHRGLDLHFYLGGELAPFENAIRALVKGHIARGHIEIRVSLHSEHEGARPGLYNRDLLSRYVSAFRQASKDFQIDAQPDLAKLFSLPGVFENGRETRQLGPQFESELLAGFALCAGELNQYRAREGGQLLAAITGELEQIESGTKAIAALRAEISEALLRRLRERVEALLGDSLLPPSRLVEEVALLVDRSDIQEELTRLTVHAAELRRMLTEGGTLGKQLDFLLQEINRETNTILSKSASIAEGGLSITNIGISLKANIERMREQALNLE